MTRTLETEQNALVAASGLAIITLVRITTYTDTVSKSIPVAHYFADKPVIYDYDNTGTDQEFESVVASFADFTRSFQHVPSPDDLRPYRDKLTINFSNQQVQGRRLITRLRDFNLLGADIEMSEIAVPTITGYPIDLSAKTGTEHTLQFAGYVRTVDNVSDTSFSLACEVMMPPIDRIWEFQRTAANGRVARQYRNIRLPIGYGTFGSWECPMIVAGGLGRLATDISSGFTGTLDVEHLEDFNQTGDDFVIRIEDEDIEVFFDAGGSDLLDIKGGGRGFNGTSAVAHSAGVMVMEYPEPDAVWAVQNHMTSSAADLPIVIQRADDVRVAFSHTPDVLNAEHVPGVISHNFAFSPAEYKALLDSSFGSDAVGGRQMQIWTSEWENRAFLSKAQEASGPRFAQGATVTVLDTFDGTEADWDGNANCTTSSDTADFVEGTGSVVAESVAGQTKMHFEKDYSPALDLTGLTLSFYTKWTQEAFDAASFESGLKWSVKFFSGGGTTNARTVWLSLDMVNPGTWQRWYASPVPNHQAGDADQGTFDITDVTKIRFRHDWEAAALGLDVRYDDLTHATSEHHYSIDAEEDISQPTDALSHWIEEMGREDIDETTRAENVTATSANLLTGDVRAIGWLWEEVAQALAFRCRANLIPEYADGRRIWRLLGADANYKFAAPSFHITEYGSCVDIGMDVAELGTDFSFMYANSPLFEDEGAEGFRKTLIANPTVSDVDVVTAADLLATRSQIGDRPYPRIKYLLIDDDDTMKDLAGYTVQESSDPGRAVLLVRDVPWTQGYKLQLGDIVSITPPYMRLGDEQIASLDGQASDWVGSGATANDASARFREGTGSLRMDVDGSFFTSSVSNTGNLPVLNFRDRAFSVWVYVESSAFAVLSSLEFRISSGASAGAQHKEWSIPKADLVADQWQKVTISLTDEESLSSGVLDPTHVRNHQFSYTQTVKTAAERIFYDDYRLEDQRIPVRIISITKKHGSQHFDFTAVEVETV